MAQKVLVSMVDDTDGSEATDTVRFGLDGADYEIDLSAVNAGKLRAGLEPYVNAARRAATHVARPRVRGGRRQSAAVPGVNSDEIRTWAKQHGYKVNDRGRIPAAITMEFMANRHAPAAVTVPATPAPEEGAEAKTATEAEPSAAVKSSAAKPAAKAAAARGGKSAATKATAAKPTAAKAPARGGRAAAAAKAAAAKGADSEAKTA